MKYLIVSLFSFGLVTAANASNSGSDATLTGTVQIQTHTFWGDAVADLTLNTGNALYTATGQVSDKNGLRFKKMQDGQEVVLLANSSDIKASKKYIFEKDFESSIYEISEDRKRVKHTDIHDVDFVYGTAHVVGKVACVEDTNWFLGDTDTFTAVGETLAAVCAFNLRLSLTNNSEISDKSAASLLRLLAKRSVKQIYALDF